MTPLYFDAEASAIAARRLRARPDAALCLRLAHSYGRGSYSYPAFRWTTSARAERDPALLRWGKVHGVSLYLTPRLWRYLSWHPLRVRGVRLGPFRWLRLAVDPLFVEDLCHWERLHPGMALPGAVAA